MFWYQKISALFLNNREPVLRLAQWAPGRSGPTTRTARLIFVPTVSRSLQPLGVQQPEQAQEQALHGLPQGWGSSASSGIGTNPWPTRHRRRGIKMIYHSINQSFARAFSSNNGMSLAQNDLIRLKRFNFQERTLENENNFSCFHRFRHPCSLPTAVSHLNFSATARTQHQ
jgi:hypothetical protein